MGINRAHATGVGILLHKELLDRGGFWSDRTWLGVTLSCMLACPSATSCVIKVPTMGFPWILIGSVFQNCLGLLLSFQSASSPLNLVPVLGCFGYNLGLCYLACWSTLGSPLSKCANTRKQAADLLRDSLGPGGYQELAPAVS